MGVFSCGKGDDVITNFHGRHRNDLGMTSTIEEDNVEGHNPLRKDGRYWTDTAGTTKPTKK
jgi:hypothetical protein